MFYTAKFSSASLSPDWWDITIAFLQDLPFTSFVLDEDNDFVAYAYTDDIEIEINELEKSVKQHLEHLEFPVDFNITAVEKSNWNETWESNFQPVTIDKKLLIRANFHPSDSSFEREICITPRMSFGTGHHETTYLMCDYLLNNSPKNFKVMDAGCGSGILAILAKQLGAGFTEAFDVEDWSVENTNENAKENGVKIDSVFVGAIDKSNENDFDLILANINRNVLLKTMVDMAKKLKHGGVLVLSGFYEADSQTLIEKAEEFGLNYKTKEIKNTWLRLVFNK